MAHKAEFVSTKGGYKVKPDGPLSTLELFVADNNGVLYGNAVLATPDSTTVAVSRYVGAAVGSTTYHVAEAAGPTTPTDAETGYTAGCTFFNLTSFQVFINTGNSSSAAFRMVELGQSTITGPGAIPLTDRTCLITTTGADALTLADGVVGQRLTVIMVVDGGAGTLTPATVTGFATLTFDDVGDSAELEFVDTLGWMLVGTPTATAA